MKHLRKRWIWMICFVIVMLALAVQLYLISTYHVQEGSWLYLLINGYGGNLLAGIFGGFLFLFLALYIQSGTDDKIDRIFSTTEQRMYVLECEAAIVQFERFMQKESHYEIRFPTGSDLLGLEYTIYPVRHPKTNEPIKKVAEAEESYVIRLVLPQGFEFMSPEMRNRYKTSDIVVGAYYFCQFFNGSWHMGTDSIGREWHKFYLSGKVGPVQWGQSANQFMSLIEDPIKEKTLLTTLHLKEDGSPLIGGGGCTSYRIYQDGDCNLFLQIHDSLLKPMYYTNPSHTLTDEGWFFVIEDMWGYAFGCKLKNIVDAILCVLKEMDVEPKKIYGYETEDKDFSLFTADN